MEVTPEIRTAVAFMDGLPVGVLAEVLRTARERTDDVLVRW